MRYFILLCLLFPGSLFAGQGFMPGPGLPVISAGNSCAGDYGLNNTPTGDDTTSNGWLFAVKVPLDCSGAVSTVAAQVKWTGGSDSGFYYAIYSDNAGEPDTKLAQAGPFYDSPGGTLTWYPKAISYTVSGDPAYVWLVIQFEKSTSGIGYYYDGSATQESRELAGTFGTLPATWDAANDSSRTTRQYNYIITF